MNKVKFGIVGIGIMGSGHASSLMDGKIENGVLSAVADIDENKINSMREKYGDKIQYFASAKELIDSKACDAVIVSTPHYFHPPIAIDVLKAGQNVLIEKPAGVYTKQVQEMIDVAKTSDKVFGIMFNQRTDPRFKKMRDIVSNGGIGEIRRTNWIITDWFRPQKYYDSGNWRATWKGEGGGVLYNQAPHNLDLFSWITGMMPSRVRAFCHFGKWHKIEVEDDVTAYVEYSNGATGTFITTTGDFPGSNRFEITGDSGRLVFDSGKLTYQKLTKTITEFSNTTDVAFSAPSLENIPLEIESDTPQHIGILNNFANAILGLEPLYARAEEGLRGVSLANAMLLSTWLDKTIELPIDGELFYNELKRRIEK